MKNIFLICALVLLWVNCFGAGLTTSSLNGVATNLTRYGTSTNLAVPQPSSGITNVIGIDSTGKELSIPISNFSSSGGGSNLLYNFNTNDFTASLVTNISLSLNVPRTNRNNTFYGTQTFVDILANTLNTSAGAMVGTDLSWGGMGSGDGSGIVNLNATFLTSGTVGTARLGTGAANSGTYLRGDGSWQPVSGGLGGTLTNVLYTNAGPADTYTVGPNAYLKTNSFGGGGITALTGDVTASGSGSVVSTLANIPTSTPMAGSLFDTAIVAPATPASGKGQIYEDSTSKNLAIKNDAGVINHGIQTRTATANQWIRSIADDGSTTISQPAFTDISGTAVAAQLPLATTSAFGAVKPDGTTILVTAGVISSVGSGGTTVTNLNPLVSTNTGTFFLHSIYGTGSIQNTNADQFGFDSTNEAFRIQGVYNGAGQHTNITVWSQGYNIPAQQAGQTNVTLVAATTQVILFLHPMPSTNYVAFVTAGSATAVAGFSPSSFTTNGFTANFTSLTLTGRLLWSVTAYTQ